MSMRLYDSHNHLQEPVLADRLEEILADTRREGIRAMVVNGSSEQDWEAVASLASRVPEVVPSFGYHPWYIKDRSKGWREKLMRYVEGKQCGIGEIGLDRWIKDHDIEAQKEVFTWQLRFAAERNLPASIHCLQAWGILLDILRQGPRPARGFLLHSYGGPREMVRPLAELGAYFSLPGYFGHSRKERQQEVFKHAPADRLLIETDAPDQLPPEDRMLFPIQDATGKNVNHPANLRSAYELAAEIRGEPLEELVKRVEQNFFRLFSS